MGAAFGAIMAQAMGQSAGDAATTPVTMTVAVDSPEQTIDGFGFATAWRHTPDPKNSAQMDAFFSTTKGAGLSILRNRIPFKERDNPFDSLVGLAPYRFSPVDLSTVGGGEVAYKNFSLNWGCWDLGFTRGLIAAIKAKRPDYQVTTIFSTPWSPPNDATSRWKLPSEGEKLDYEKSPEVGGYLDPAHYQDYADVLADYVLQFNDPAKGNMGLPLTALSLQNEPNFRCRYDSADWSAQQFHDFIGVLKTEFTNKGVFTADPDLEIMFPENNAFSERLVSPTLNDPDTASMVQIIGAHQYDAGPWNMGHDSSIYAPPVFKESAAAGKKIWMTEWNTEAFGKWSEIEQTLAMGQLIAEDFTITKANAYVYWWGTDLMEKDGTPNKELYGLAQYSRFIRPGWKMAPISDSHPRPLVFTSAFVDPTGSNLAVVVVNRSKEDFAMALSSEMGSLGAGTVVRTSATEDMAMVGSFDGGAVCPVDVPAMSIVTVAVGLRR